MKLHTLANHLVKLNTAELKPAVLPQMDARKCHDCSQRAAIQGGMVMKKYEYVRVKIGGFINSKCAEHRGIIDEYAAKGYWFIGYIPTEIEPYGRFMGIDLIFEMEIERKPQEPVCK